MPRPSTDPRHGATAASVLLVCEGNVCRSPLAEQLLRQGLANLGVDDVTVASAGTRARVGDGADPDTRAVASDLGIDLSGHVARQVEREMVAEAELVLTATRALRSDVTTLHPRALGYTFTIRQLGRILEEVARDRESLEHDGPVLRDLTAVSRVRALAALARRARGQHFVPDPTDEDVVDPWARGGRVQQAAAEQIVPSIERVVEVLSAAEDGRQSGTRSHLSA